MSALNMIYYITTYGAEWCVYMCVIYYLFILLSWNLYGMHLYATLEGSKCSLMFYEQNIKLLKSCQIDFNEIVF